MFTGIIEKLGQVLKIESEGENIHFEIEAPFHNELYIDQSIAHNGVCLTIVDLKKTSYIVTAIYETLIKSNLKYIREGDYINLERAMLPNTRLDGHFVQGHVDTVFQCTNIIEKEGSWYFNFDLPKQWFAHIVDKGSICINGTSLTVICDPDDSSNIMVAIIPYTFDNTNFRDLKKGDKVNIEFDILGKYVLRSLIASKS